MECERLQRLVKNWYAQVLDEAMAPARMVLFLENHIADCQTCLADPLIRQEVEKITAIILPPTKIRKATASLEEDEEALRSGPEEELEEGDEGEESGEDASDGEEGDDEPGEEEEFGDEDDDI